MLFLPARFVCGCVAASLAGMAGAGAGAPAGSGKAGCEFASPFERGGSELQIGLGGLFSWGEFSALRPRLNEATGSVRLGRMLTSPAGDGWLRGNVELLGEGFGSAVVEGPGKVIAGVTLLLRYNFIPPAEQWVPYFQIGFGGAYSDAHEERPQILLGSAFEFNLQAGIGLRRLLNARTALFVETSYRHLSNADLAAPNAGLNSIGGLLGVSWFF